eukprot:jgi/Botrbrau1/11851/Bobra.0175s0013.1
MAWDGAYVIQLIASGACGTGCSPAGLDYCCLRCSTCNVNSRVMALRYLGLGPRIGTCVGTRT